MNAAAILEQMASDGLHLALSASGSIKTIGDYVAVARWLPVVREHKMEMIAVLQSAANDPTGNALPALTAEEETAIRAWLALIEETDPATITEVIERCQQDTEARSYFTGQAAAEVPKPDPFLDDRRTCDQCVNLIARRCQAAKRGEIVASRNYEPIRDPPRRCEGYAPRTADPDRRHGRERWPGLGTNANSSN